MEVVTGEFPNRARQQRGELPGPCGVAVDELHGGGDPVQFLVGGPLAGPVEHHDHVQLREPSKAPAGLQHENRSAVHRRADRVGGDEQNFEALRIGGQRSEPVSEVSAKRPPESFGVIDNRQPPRRPA